MERGVLMHLNHVGLVKLHFSFQGPLQMKYKLILYKL